MIDLRVQRKQNLSQISIFHSQFGFCGVDRQVLINRRMVRFVTLVSLFLIPYIQCQEYEDSVKQEVEVFKDTVTAIQETLGTPEYGFDSMSQVVHSFSMGLKNQCPQENVAECHEAMKIVVHDAYQNYKDMKAMENFLGRRSIRTVFESRKHDKDKKPKPDKEENEEEQPKDVEPQEEKGKDKDSDKDDGKGMEIQEKEEEEETIVELFTEEENEDEDFEETVEVVSMSLQEALEEMDKITLEQTLDIIKNLKVEELEIVLEKLQNTAEKFSTLVDSYRAMDDKLPDRRPLVVGAATLAAEAAKMWFERRGSQRRNLRFRSDVTWYPIRKIRQVMSDTVYAYVSSDGDAQEAALTSGFAFAEHFVSDDTTV